MLTVGKAREMVEARVQDTTDILEKQSKKMEDLDRVVGHVKILVIIVGGVAPV